MNNKEQIKDAASCLLGISDDWKYNDVKGFLNWQLNNLDELPEGYPKEVMKYEYKEQILEQVEILLRDK
jgi:hypothetical protein